MTINSFSEFIYSDLTEEDTFICVLGFESRSHYLLLKNLATRNNSNTLIVYLGDSAKVKIPETLRAKIEGNHLRTETCSYTEVEQFHNLVVSFINDTVFLGSKEKIYIDYSSMPRNWYCSLPSQIEKKIKKQNLQFIFLYVAGIYPEEYESYPTAGISSLKIFSGGGLPKIDSARNHLIALGYDTIKTQSILSMLEPEFLIVCYAYDNSEMKSEIETVNRDIIRRASASIALPINDFIYMFQKFNEIIIEQTRDGQIVIIPDGPKPLIFAMALSSICNEQKNGITCLQINRNEKLIENLVEVSARDGVIYAFKMSLT